MGITYSLHLNYDYYTRVAAVQNVAYVRTLNIEEITAKVKNIKKNL